VISVLLLVHSFRIRITSQRWLCSSCGHVRGVGNGPTATFHIAFGMPHLRIVASVSMLSRLVVVGAHTAQKFAPWAIKEM
jgi:hypothetical protein